MIRLTGGISWSFYYYVHSYLLTDLKPAVGLVVAMALSRVGLWGFDLSVQNIVQDVSISSILRFFCGFEARSCSEGPRPSPGYILHYLARFPERV